ncbi:hypothetical protein ACIRYZ_23075 [Kitasatospora sp. NPDC101155]|uniref:hypothetical protein n=1 Tax=Kitasatospora sp. NPDC101155 TaxID=3364097 RepID=UPI00380208AD
MRGTWGNHPSSCRIVGHGVGPQIVAAYPAATGLSAARSSALSAREILRSAGTPTKA